MAGEHFRVSRACSRIRHLAAMLLVAGCAAAGPGREIPATHRQDSDQVLLGVLQFMRAAHQGAAKYDPHYVRIDADIRYPDANSYYVDDRQQRLSLAPVLASLRLDTARAFPLRESCSPLMAPPGHKVLHGCPAIHTVIVAFDNVRRQDGSPPRWTVRAIEIEYGPAGRSARIAEYVTAVVGGRQVVQQVIVLAHID